jgi:dTDP-4-amino-4,6-dideoxygalactose transaminase
MSQQLSLLGGTPVRTRGFTAWPIFDSREETRLTRAVHSGKWGKLQGTEVTEFEARFAAMHGARSCIAVVNGTVALRLALLAAELPAESEVIVPPYTFLATASAAIEANLIPVFADIELDTFNLSPAAVEAAITPRTRAIVPVHLGGQPVEMDAILAIARRHRLVVIEDAAQAHGASYHDRPVGAIGNGGTFSFQSSKNLTCGEGGAIVTVDVAFADACRSLHNCGRIPGGLWYEHHAMGGNYRLGEFQGAVLNAQLDRFEEQAEVRERNGLVLARKLRAFPGVHPQARPPGCTRHAYHLFLFRIESANFGAPRAAVLQALRAEGIPVSSGYGMPLYRQPIFVNRAFASFLPQAVDRLDYRQVSCPNCETICNEQGGWFEQNLLLGTESDLDDVVRAFEKIHARRDELQTWHQRRNVGESGDIPGQPPARTGR